jgi:hypothetical protein
MTLLGKLLAFVNLIVGLGLLSWSVSVYSLRPGWFAPVPEAVSSGQRPESFAQMKLEIESLILTAKSANENWGAQQKILEGLEAKRASRQKLYEERLKWTRTGNPKDSGNGFYEPVFEKDSHLLDLTTVGAPIKGPDNLPLKGSDTLMNTFANDVKELEKLEMQIAATREEFLKISAQISRNEARLRGVTDIRESVQAELFFLASFEVNVYETRETILRRKKQLTGRLSELGK